MRNKQKGMILFCTLVIMVILSVLLMVGVYRMQSSTMVTKRMIWEIKSYWTARAGNTIAADGAIRNSYWPVLGQLPVHAGISKAGDYDIHYDTANKVVKGEVKDADGHVDSSFAIYYKNKLNPYAAASEVLETTLGIVMPNPYYSDSNSVESVFKSNFENTVSTLKSGEMYCLTVGKSKVAVCGLELIYNLSYNARLIKTNHNQDTLDASESTSASAAMYVAGNINANINDLFSVDATDMTRACIVSGGNVSITSNSSDYGKTPNGYGEGPINMDEGAIFVGGNATLNGEPISPSNTNSNLTNYGVNVYSSSKIEFQYPDEVGTAWGKTIPSGTFCFIEMPDKYDEREYRNLVSSIKNIYLTPEEFCEIYKDDIKGNAADHIDTIYEAVKNDKVDEVCYDEGKCSQIFDDILPMKDKDGVEGLETKFKDLVGESNFISDILDMLGGNVTNDDLAPIMASLYRSYMINRVNMSVSEYKADGDGKKYEAFFIPEGSAGISSSVSYHDFHIFYSQFTRARVIGNLCEYIDDPNKLQNSTLNKVFANFNMSSKLTGEDGEIKKYNKHLENVFNSADLYDGYVTDKITVGGGTDLFILDKYSQHKDQSVVNKFSTSKEYIDFDTKDLKMKVSSNLKSRGDDGDDGYFNFATFDRRGNTSSRYTGQAGGYEHDAVGDYKSSDAERAGIEFTASGGIVAQNIDVKGFVYGSDGVDGFLQSTKGNVSFEASGTSILQTGEAKVSVLSKNNINIKRVSATNSGAANTSGNVQFKGILFSGKDIDIDVGSNNVNFGLQGTIICEGSFTMNHINQVNITYDPSVSSIVINRFVPTWNSDQNALSEELKTGSKYTVQTGSFKLFNRI